MSWAGPPRSTRRLLIAIALLIGALLIAAVMGQLVFSLGGSRAFAVLVVTLGFVGISLLLIAGVFRLWRPGHSMGAAQEEPRLSALAVALASAALWTPMMAIILYFILPRHGIGLVIGVLSGGLVFFALSWFFYSHLLPGKR